jgi:hypothetical protein
VEPTGVIVEQPGAVVEPPVAVVVEQPWIVHDSNAII